MRIGKRQMTDGIEQPNQVVIRTLGKKETYKYLGIWETDTIKQMEMKEKITWTLPLVRYSGLFLKWTRE